MGHSSHGLQRFINWENAHQKMACADFLGESMYKDYSLSLRKEVFIWDNETTGPLVILLEVGVYGIGNNNNNNNSCIYGKGYLEFPYLALGTLVSLKSIL